jgi:hypothetical protein
VFGFCIRKFGKFEKDPPRTHIPIAQQEQEATRVYLSGWSWRRLGVGAWEHLRQGAFLGGWRVEREEVVQGLRATMDAKDLTLAGFQEHRCNVRRWLALFMQKNDSCKLITYNTFVCRKSKASNTHSQVIT